MDFAGLHSASLRHLPSALLTSTFLYFLATMSKLELKVPPVLLVVLFAVAMYAMSAAMIEGRADGIPTLLSVMCAVAGGLISIAGVVQFRKVKTTVNPVNPASASSLVTSGIYKVSRNPMYLGFLLILLAWAFFCQTHIP